MKQKKSDFMKPTEKVLDLIYTCDIFRCADKALLKSILSDDGVEIMEYKKNDIIYSVSSYNLSVGIIFKGNAKVIKDESGAVISTLKKGDIFGCASLFADKDYYVNDIISIGESKVVFIKKDSCEKLMKSDSGFAIGFVIYLSNRLYFLNTRIDTFTGGSAENKIASYLLSKFQNDGSPQITVSMSRLAQSANVARASCYRAVQSLCDLGAIEKDGKTISILSEEKLRKLLPR